MFVIADAFYLALSLEGPRWVIYALQGNLGNGDTLTPGTVLDLNEMRNSGEVFSTLLASEETLKDVVSDLQRDIPREEPD